MSEHFKVSKENLLDLQRIKNFIVDKVREACTQEIPDESGFYEKLDKFLGRLITKTDGRITKDDLYKMKAGMQLLCCIGIDIASGTVPVAHYLKIFQAAKLEDEEKEARNLFWDAVLNSRLLYRESQKRETEEYDVIVYPICHWKYYTTNDALGLTGEKQLSDVYNKLMEPGKVSLYRPEMKKDLPGSFWITNGETINTLLAEINASAVIVDRLGLSHYDLNDPKYHYYFRIRIGKKTIETYKPNATIVDWTNPRVGFLSDPGEDSGRTFSISGFRSRQRGLHERVFNDIQFSSEELKNSYIQSIPPRLDRPIEIKCDELIIEGINRFKKKTEQ